MTGQQLKNSILQEAIEGRLVPQDPNDEPASVLLERIRAEKARLMKEKKIKKDKNESRIYRTEDGHWMEHFEDKNREDVCIDEEIPFDIPSGWEWCRITNIALSELGKTLDRGKEEGNIYPYLCSINVYWNRIDLSNVKTFKLKPIELERYRLKKGDLLICEGGDYARCYVWNNDIEMYYQNALHRVRFYLGISPWFYKYIFEFYKNRGIIIGRGQTIKHFTFDNMKSLLFPLPPLAEQHRIVEKIESLLPKVEAYGKAQEELEKLNEALPEQLKKSILQEAIEGRLVPQDPNDEPASVLLERIRAEKARLVKEKKIKKSRTTSNTELQNTEQVNFDIPGNWCWTTLGEICIFLSRGKSPKYSETDKTYPVFAQKCNLKDGGISLEQARFLDPSSISKWDDIYKLRTGDVLINSTGTGTVCRTRLFDEKYLGIYPFVVPDSHVSVVRTSEYIYSEFVLAYISSKTIQQFLEDNLAGSTNQKELYIGVLEKLPIPLPPLAEQHRIVEKLEEILPKLNNLKKETEK